MQGRALSGSTLEIINTYRVREFHSRTTLNKNDPEVSTSLFFLLYSKFNHRLLAFGKLRRIPIVVQGKKEKIICISTVIAIQKGKGLGRLLMSSVKKYLLKTNKPALGFCETELLPFYKKCGFTLIEPKLNNFVYMNKRHQVIPNIVPGEVFYFSPSRSELVDLISDGKTQIGILRAE